MKNPLLFLWMLLCLYTVPHLAQYTGGHGDGFSSKTLPNITLNNLSLSILFQGANGDGFDTSRFNQTTLNNISISVLYTGGPGDGFDVNQLNETSLSNTSFVVLYGGGQGDGFDTSRIQETSLSNTSFALLFGGGQGDGFDVSRLDQTTLNNISLAMLFGGGQGDGFSSQQEVYYLDSFEMLDLLLAIKVFLQGPLLTPVTPNLMNDDLRQNFYIPSTSPYSDMATIDPNILEAGGASGSGSSEDDIVDWVWLELRHNSDNTSIIQSRSVLLQRDGDIVDLDGLSNITIQGFADNYYVVVNHRNHLAIMSNTSIGLSNTLTTLNFSNSTTETFGNHAQIQLENGSMAMWAGDANTNNNIRFSGGQNDSNAFKDFILNDPLNFFENLSYASPGYNNEDINMDGVVKFLGLHNDRDIIKNNIDITPLNILNLPTYRIQNTVPEGN